MTSQSGLTALQRRIRRIVGELPLGPKLALAGGFRAERLARILGGFDQIEPTEFADYSVDYRRLQTAIRDALAQIEHHA